jgi:hypothetical protein
MLRHCRRPVATDEIGWHVLGLGLYLPGDESLVRTGSTAELLFDRVAQVLYHVETVCDLARLWCASNRSLGVEAAPIAADDLDLRMMGEPFRRPVRGAVRQYVEDFPPLQIHHDRPVA